MWYIPPQPKYVAAQPVQNQSSNLGQITNVLFDETKHILPQGSADKTIVKFARTHTLEDAYVTRQLHH